MTSLTTLRLAENQLSGAIPASIAALTGLNMLFLSVNKLTNGLQYLAQLQGLSHLEAASNDFSGKLVECACYAVFALYRRFLLPLIQLHSVPSAA
jgi:hypothetical protein